MRGTTGKRAPGGLGLSRGRLFSSSSAAQQQAAGQKCKQKRRSKAAETRVKSLTTKRTSGWTTATCRGRCSRFCSGQSRIHAKPPRSCLSRSTSPTISNNGPTWSDWKMRKKKIDGYAAARRSSNTSLSVAPPRSGNWTLKSDKVWLFTVSLSPLPTLTQPYTVTVHRYGVAKTSCLVAPFQNKRHRGSNICDC